VIQRARFLSHYIDLHTFLYSVTTSHYLQHMRQIVKKYRDQKVLIDDDTKFNFTVKFLMANGYLILYFKKGKLL
jgi:L-lactate utilization protein LutC